MGAAPNMRFLYVSGRANVTPVVTFLVGVILAAGSDLLIWSQINFIRNVPIPDSEKVPFLYRPAMKFDLPQIARWIGIGALISGCNVFLHSALYVAIIAATMIFCIIHLALSTMKYWRAFSAAAKTAGIE
jgi:hypothetical protein